MTPCAIQWHLVGGRRKRDTKEGGEENLGGVGREGDYDPNLGHAILKDLRKSALKKT